VGGEVDSEFWLGNLREIDHLEDLSIDVRIIIKLIFQKEHGVVEWID
jgi:hypothetical protein